MAVNIFEDDDDGGINEREYLNLPLQMSDNKVPSNSK